MKNAMKKLTSLLLVAVLLVGAIPFSALAADEEVSFATGAEVAAANIAPAAETPAAETPAPVANVEGEVSFGTSTPAANSQITANEELKIVLVVDACAGCGVTAKTYTDVSVAPNTTVGAVVKAMLSLDNAAWDALHTNYIVTYKNQNDAAVAASGVIDAALTKIVVKIAARPVEVVPATKYNITLKIDGTPFVADKAIEEGTVLNLNDNLAAYFGLTLPEGQTAVQFKENIYKNGAINKTAIIANTYTVNGKAEILMITAPSNLVNGGNTTGGTTGGNATGGTTGGNTTGGTTGGTNTQPSGEYTIRFMNYNNTAVLHTTTTVGGRITAEAAQLANYKAAENAPAGYVFGNRWKENNAGASIDSDTIVHRLTFTQNTDFVPVFTAQKSDVVTSIKNQNDIILNIFVNKDFNNCKTVRLNDHRVIADDKITTYEILNYVVTDYYKASNGNLGLQCDGMYYAVGSFMYNWLLDNTAVKVDAIDGIAAKRADGVVTINIMVTNAVAKNGAAADKSNPKTGDEIYTAMTVMGLSAASLAAVMFFYNKKRYTV